MHHAIFFATCFGLVWASAAVAVGLIAGRAIRLADEHEAPRALAREPGWRI